MFERPAACPACDVTVLIRSEHACGRQRWRCKGCGRQFNCTDPRGKPGAMKAAAVELYCTGLSLNAIGKRLGVLAQSVMRWVRDHARRHQQALDLEGV
jgi:transposase-like protein